MARIVGVGNPLWDVFAGARENAHLVRGGGESGTYHVRSAEMWKTLNELNDETWAAGGSARNTLAVLAAFAHQTYLVGAVGGNARGERYRASLAEVGIADCLVETEGPTGVCLTFFDPQPLSSRSGPGAKQVIVAPGAAAAPIELTPYLPNNPNVVHIEGYVFARRNLIEELVEYAASSDSLLSIDLGHPTPVTTYWGQVRASIDEARDRFGWNRAPIVFGTEAEVAASAGSLQEATDTLTEAGYNVVVKKGVDGAAVFGVRERGDYPVVPVGRVVDDTGSGDIFAGAFLAGVLGGMVLGDCCRLGNFAAGLSLTNIGGRLTSEQYRVLLDRFEALWEGKSE